MTLTEWGVFGVIVALIGFAGIFWKLSATNTKALTELNQGVIVLNSRLESLTTDNTNSHRRIWETVDKHGDQIIDLDKRVCIVEHMPPNT